MPATWEKEAGGSMVAPGKIRNAEREACSQGRGMTCSAADMQNMRSPADTVSRRPGGRQRC